MIRSPGCALLSVLMVAGHAANAASPQQSGSIAKVLRCEEIAQSERRLACFDAAVAGLHDAPSSATAPPAIFGHQAHAEKGDSSTPTTLLTAVKSARRGADGHWIIVLSDGGAWRQVDADQTDIDPHPGTKVSIRRAALGSYFARLDNGHAIRLLPLN